MKNLVTIIALMSAIIVASTACENKGPGPEAKSTYRHDPDKLGDGMWEVGSQTNTGEYETIVPYTTDGCAWFIWEDDKGKPEDLVDSRVILPGRGESLTITEWDHYVEFSGGCTWTRKK